MEELLFSQVKYFIRILIFVIILIITVTFLLLKSDEYWRSVFSLLIGIIVKSPVPTSKSPVLPVSELDTIDGTSSCRRRTTR